MSRVTPPPRLSPLYLAGFTTAFGAHGVAAALGTETDEIGLTFWALGLILALYDIAEVILKPLFGALSDRIGTKPVIVGGLLVFAAASVLGAFAASPVLLAVARLAQGGAAAAFSPASSSAVARLVGPGQAGRSFGRYGSWKSLGYAGGPILGGVLILWLGLPALFVALAVLAAAAAALTAWRIPALPVLPKQRVTVRELVRQSTAPAFLGPVVLLATATATLGVAVGFFPLVAAQLGVNPVVGMGVVSVIAVVSAVAQPRVGGIHDSAAHLVGPTMTAGAVLLVGGLALVAVAPSLPSLLTAAVLVGLGVGIITPLGFARLAATTPADRMGRAMGSAELGREIGDAGGPILVGAVAAASALPLALGAMAVVAAGSAAAGGLLAARDAHGATAKPTEG
ncbi:MULTISPECIES: MFS transporter [Microbacterium]|uniref:MFS transporter n=1 Tax=Microbacterium TaxID=33882 RepID=UPI002784A443|nr:MULTISPECIES: MFS transporter [Microbacterium]MDQ1082535.1 MFS family permease [Microbacterium sp. SORGH_AS_0344]MDQ1168693.1 MFS family permease [Microbacterium proteolyticum]